MQSRTAGHRARGLSIVFRVLYCICPKFEHRVKPVVAEGERRTYGQYPPVMPIRSSAFAIAPNDCGAGFLPSPPCGRTLGEGWIPQPSYLRKALAVRTSKSDIRLEIQRRAGRDLFRDERGCLCIESQSRRKCLIATPLDCRASQLNGDLGRDVDHGVAPNV